MTLSTFGRYTGVGSRSTPIKILHEFTNIARKLAEEDYILRSGGADGADHHFESGCDLANGRKEIYLPWKGFNNNKSFLYKVTPEALTLAAGIHPAWNMCSQGARKLHARNCYQVLGLDLESPSDFVICWTPNGEVKGGTATAIKLAILNNIPVYNFGKDTDKARFYEEILNDK